MAEATLVETEVTPAEDAAVVVPESPAESTPAPENVEETSAVDAFLESIGTASVENAGGNGQNAAPDAVVPPAPVGPTPEQIRADERSKLETQNRINGLKWVVSEDAPAKLAKLRDELSAEGWETLTTEINRMKGAFEPLLQRASDVDTTIAPAIRTAAHKEAEDFTFGQLAELAKTELGIDLADSRANFRSWQDVGKLIVKEARKGMVPSADYVSKASTKQHLEKLETALKERGASGIVTRSLAELTGSTGPDTPVARGSSARVGTTEWAENASIEELLAAKARGAY